MTLNENKDNLTDIGVVGQRRAVLQLIEHTFYPETEYPITLFPDRVEVLWNCFSQALADIPELRKTYKDTYPDNLGALESLVKERLEFQNLLQHHPQTVVMLYQTSIKKFIRYQQSRSRGLSDEWEDLFQEVITRLISGKIQRIREKFDFSYSDGIKKSTFTSYLMVTVRNIYMDIIRERQVRPLTSGDYRPIDEVHDLYKDKHEAKHMLNRLVMDEEFSKLRTVLALHYRSRQRLELCLKLKCRLTVTKKDVKQCFPACNRNDIETLALDYKSIKDNRLFDEVVAVFNRNEGRKNKSDTLRKWISIKVDEILEHMNRTHTSNVYTPKNLLDFITLYYERVKQDNNQKNQGEIG
jgi:DNA-directed RNA polymerase specialized sigma24 family protein